MSRVLKFRAWDKENEEYINGYDVLLRYDGFALSRYALVTFDTDMPVNVIIEQYTGLRDKNCKEIYEGDILETCCGKAEVYFDNELLMYKIEVRHGGTMPLVSKKSKRHFDYEIIGNIHENPELLGGEE